MRSRSSPLLLSRWLCVSFIFSAIRVQIELIVLYSFGTVAAPAAPATILACNSGFGACSAKCAALFLAAPAAAGSSFFSLARSVSLSTVSPVATWGFPLITKIWGAGFVAREFWRFKENFSKYSGFWNGTAENSGQGMCAWSERSFDERSFD